MSTPPGSPPPEGPLPDPGTTPWRTALATGRWQMPNGEERVMLIAVRDDVLQFSLFMTPDQAARIGEELQKHAACLRSGIVIPDGQKISLS